MSQRDSFAAKRVEPLDFEIDAANVYQELFVPAEFQEWAPRVAAAARIQPGERVLDVACGTGVLAREVASRVGPGGSVAGLDMAPAMLAVASRLAPHVEWRQGAAESLPYPDGSFDAVVSQFGLMFFADRRLALAEMLRVLVPGGRLAVAVWDSLAHTPAYAAEVALVERLDGPAAAAPLRSPFVLGDVAGLAALFSSAGVAEVAVTTQRGTARFPAVRTMLDAELRGWLPLAGVVLSEEVMASILREGERVLAPWVEPDGTVSFESPAHLVTGTRT